MGEGKGDEGKGGLECVRLDSSCTEYSKDEIGPKALKELLTSLVRWQGLTRDPGSEGAGALMHCSADQSSRHITGQRQKVYHQSHISCTKEGWKRLWF